MEKSSPEDKLSNTNREISDLSDCTETTHSTDNEYENTKVEELKTPLDFFGFPTPAKYCCEDDRVKGDDFISTFLFSRRKKRSRYLSTAFFFLGIGTFFPWNCIVMDFHSTSVQYFPTFPWVETATQIRTLCFLLGNILLLWIGPILDLQFRTFWTCCLSAIISICFALIPILLEYSKDFGISADAEKFAFHVSCVLAGIVGLVGCLLHSGIYALHSLINKEHALDWSIGGGFGGPLSTLFAVCFFVVFPSGATGARQRTFALFFVCAFWMVLSAIALRLALKEGRTLADFRQMEQERLIYYRKCRQSVIPKGQDDDGNIEENVFCDDGLDLFKDSFNSVDSYYNVALKIKGALIGCFILFLSTYMMYPVRTERMHPRSAGFSQELHELVLVASFQLGNVFGRLMVLWGLRTPAVWLPSLIILRLTLIPISFQVEGNSALSCFQQDIARIILLFLFALLHGWLSVMSAFYLPQSQNTSIGKEKAAYLMCFSESLGLALGVSLSILLPSAHHHHRIVNNLGDKMAMSSSGILQGLPKAIDLLSEA